MGDSERLTDLARSYVLGQATEEELRELSRLMEKSEASKEKVARALAEAGLIAGWFTAESDGQFVAEALAAIQATGSGQTFVENTLDRIRRSPRSTKLLRARRRTRERSGLFPILMAASLLVTVVVGVLLISQDGPTPSDEPSGTVSRNDSEGDPGKAPLPEEKMPEKDPVPENAPDESPPFPPKKPARNAIVKESEKESPKPTPQEAPPVKTPPPTKPVQPEERKTVVGVPIPPPGSARTLTVEVESRRGEVRQVVGEKVRALSRAVDLLPGCVIETVGQESEVTLKFADGTLLWLGGNARFEGSYVGNADGLGEADRKKLVLHRGVLWATVSKQASGNPFIISTSHGAVRVLGTIFRLRTTPGEAGETTVWVREGSVRLSRKDGKSIEVESGSFATSPPKGMLRRRRVVTLSFQDGVSPTPKYSGTRDAQITEYAPDRAYGRSRAIWVDGDSRESGNSEKDQAGLLKWDLSIIPRNARVVSAELGIRVTNRAAGKGLYRLHPLRRPWTEGSATWNVLGSRTRWQIPGAQGEIDRTADVMGALSPSKTGLYSVRLTEAGISVVQSWISRPMQNHGLVVSDTRHVDAISFLSREATDLQGRPRLTVSFVSR